MSVNQEFEKTGSIAYLCDEYLKNNFIDPEASERLGVKRGLRNPDGTGVLAGLTNVCDVVGYDLVDGKRVPTDGKLIYRGIDVEQIVRAAYAEDRFVFEEVIWLLLFGSLPTPHQLASFKQVLEAHRELPKDFAEDMIMKAPSPNIMNKMARSVLALYSYDDNPEEQSLTNILSQSIALIASLPTIMVNAYQIKRRVYDRQSMYLHLPQPGQSTAEHILSTYRADQKFTKEEAKLLVHCLVLHADHVGGNNSTFTMHVVTSSGTDTYSAVAASLASLKGPKHGGANIKVVQMFEDMKQNVRDWTDEEAVEAYLRALLHREAFDRAGLIYGMGHAVYSLSDPRANVFKHFVEMLSEEKGRHEEYALYAAVARLAPKVIGEERKIYKGVSANIDFYSGFVYSMLDLPLELYTPIFAISRIAGWSAHRIEELINAGKIIRPAYKSVKPRVDYVPLHDRK